MDRVDGVIKGVPISNERIDKGRISRREKNAGRATQRHKPEFVAR